LSSAKLELGHLKEGCKKLQSVFKKVAENTLPRSQQKRRNRVPFLLRLQWASRRAELPMDEQHKSTYQSQRSTSVSTKEASGAQHPPPETYTQIRASPLKTIPQPTLHHSFPLQHSLPDSLLLPTFAHQKQLARINY